MSIPTGEWQAVLQALPQGPGGREEPPELFREAYDLPQQGRRVAARYARLTAAFRERFPGAPLLLARAPGRINLIGEHTDYNGLPVMPMAVDRDVAALFCSREDAGVVLTNTDPAFPERRFQATLPVAPGAAGDWGNYCKAAVQALMEHFRGGPQERSWRGFQATVDGNIPPAAGMSSSSALVVLFALIFLRVNSLEMEVIELAGLLAAAERYVGTQGGGMDQAISLMGRPGQALKIDFFPLRTRPAPLPTGYAFVVANSLVQAAKSADALDRYNRRPIECRLAAAVLRMAFSRRLGREPSLSLLGDLKPEKLGLSEEEITQTARGALHERPYTLRELSALLGEPPEAVAAAYCSRRDGTIFPEPADGFKLFQRYRHVVEEGRRVEAAFAALQRGEVTSLGRLMNESHGSCRDLYEISCPELDALVEIALKSGALGSRLTGAGFGGCTVSLVESGRVGRFISALAREYYRGLPGREEGELEDLVFPSRAARGAGVLGG